MAEHNTGSRFKEADLMGAPAVDFELRNITEYPAQELLELMTAAQYFMEAPATGASMSREKRSRFSCWCYRLRDAYLVASKRERDRKP